MGYYYNIHFDCSLRIPASNVRRAMERLSSHTLPAADVDQEPVEFFRGFGLRFTPGEPGTDLWDSGGLGLWAGESRYESGMNFLAAIADLVEPGPGYNEAFVIWQGEGGDYIRQVFSDGTCRKQRGRVVFDG